MRVPSSDMTRAETARGISYVRRGCGRPVLLLHGWCLDGSLWAYEEELLVNDHEVVIPDLPGFGRSDAVAEPYDMATHVDAVAELLEELDLTDVLIVGFAFGAAVGLSLAARDDSRIAGIVAVGVPSSTVFPAERMAKSIRRDWPDFARRSAAVLCRQPQSEATLAWIERTFGQTPLRSALQGVSVLGEFAPEPVCSAVGVPVLFVHGEDDDVIAVDVARACAKSAPRGDLEVLPDCGHLVVLDQRGPLHEAVLRFERNLNTAGAR